MSVDITIKQAGVAQDIDDATKIHVNLYGVGSVNYVPEDEIEPYIQGTIDGEEYIVTVDSEGDLVYTPVGGE